jgi:site-specific recombinase XerD
MRTDEILHLTWGDVGADVDSDGEHAFIMVSPKDGWSPKSHHKRRINVSARVLGYLRARREEVKFKGETDYVFSTRKGTPMDIQGACRVIRTVFESAGLYRPGDALIHRIRHSYATHQIEGRTDLNTLRRILGHADIATTQRYLHATDRALREAVKSALV